MPGKKKLIYADDARRAILEEDPKLAYCIDRIKPVDAVELVHGRKAESAISKTGLMCTACYSDIDRDAVFCKYCGAKMDGDRDGTLD